MRAAIIHGKGSLEIRELPTPVPAVGQVRLRVTHVGICGSDLHYYVDGANGAFQIREPLVPGHELSGTVDLDPSGRLGAGTPVTVHPATFGTTRPGIDDKPHLWPGGSYLGSASTWPHTQGAMADYLVVDAPMVRRLPDGLPAERAALAEPLAVALHGINQAGGVRGARVLVAGAGPIGLLAMGAALAEGAAEVTVTDVLPGPLRRAEALGATATLDVTTHEVPLEAFDVVLECSGAPASINAGLLAARRAAHYVQLGMVADRPSAINLAPAISKEVTMRGSFRFNDEIDDAIGLLAEDERLGQVVTHTFNLSRVVEAFDTAQDSEGSGKVLVDLRA
ncbi:zinc-binding dehydrogenase [Pseudactinotalea sp. HY158]|uniref:zinc-binding dehydrogenase n=1 Tax=Pseudactinotalea sp. HY158 TaxID=2654547 RepID=UPI00129D0D00|nr:zinc-binding dehydrogenase [Pseudactinotalea sp. HY158]QGH68522.1 zinc-binding dehydrogenase [Pseudactinotalea sp. HY158]